MLLRLLAVIAFAFALYAHTLGFGFTYLDDDVLVLDDQAFLSQPSSVERAFSRPYFPSASRDHAYYRPLVTASFAIDTQLGGKDPRAYHLTNVVLHALAAGTLFLLLQAFGHRGNVALFGALVFAAHPSLTETVAWIPGRTDSLMTVFALVSWLFFRRSMEPGRWASRVIHSSAWLCALFSKELALVLPLLLLTRLVLLERRPWRSCLAPWPVLGWVAVLTLYLAARASALGDNVGAEGLELATVVANAPVVLSSLGKLVLPVQLSVLATREGTWLWPGVLAAGGFVLLWVTNRPLWPRASRLFPLLCFLAWVAPSLPASSVLTLESRLYLPAVAVVFWVSELAGRVAWPVRSRLSVAAIIVAALGATSFAYSHEFRDRATFSHAAVRGSPQSSLAHRNLGVTLQLAGDVEAARREYQAALAADPSEPVVRNNLAVILLRKGLMAEAEQELRKELAINPRYAPAHRNLALVLHALGRVDEAAKEWEASLALDGRDVEAMRALLGYYGPRDAAKAARFQQLLEVHPSGSGPAPAAER